MFDDVMQIWHDDDEVNDEIEAGLKSLPPEVRHSLGRVVRSSTRNDGQHAARRDQIEKLQGVARSSYQFCIDYERALAHGEPITEQYTERYQREKARRAKALADVKKARETPVTPNLPDDTAFEFIRSEAKGRRYVHAPVTLKSPADMKALAATREKIKDREGTKATITREILPFEEAVKQLETNVRRNALAPDFGRVAKLYTPPHEWALATTVKNPRQGEVHWPTREIVAEGGERIATDEATRLMCYLFADQIIAKGTEELKKFYAGRKGLSIAERNKQLAAIDAEILELERLEEAQVRSIEDTGEFVARRPRANMEAVLQIRRA